MDRGSPLSHSFFLMPEQRPPIVNGAAGDVVSLAHMALQTAISLASNDFRYWRPR